MLHAPGETAGHSVVRVMSGGRSFYDLTDLVHFPCEVAHPDWAPWGCDAATSARTRRRLFGEIVAAEALLTFAHARFPGWGASAARPSGRSGAGRLT